VLAWARRQLLIRRVFHFGLEADLAQPQVAARFERVLAAYTPEGLSLMVVPAWFVNQMRWPSRVGQELGGVIEFGGLLYDDTGPVALIQRRILLGRREATHGYLYVLPHRRGERIGLQSVMKSIEFYDSIGITRIYAQAALETGRWYWASCGFEFANNQSREDVRTWARLLVVNLGRQYDVDAPMEPADFLALGGDDTVNLEAIASAFPQDRVQIEQIAQQNQKAMTDDLPFGQALLMTGPEWYGVLDLTGPARARFVEHARARIGPA